MSTQSPSCPACASAASEAYAFADGVIHVCGDCRLQWADKAGVQNFDGFDDVTGVHARYVDPASIDAATYQPYRDFFAALERRGKSGGRLLDVGCGNGVFLGEALRRGWDAMGVEPDPAMRGRIRADLLSRVVPATIETAGDLGGAFDVVTFWDSFEHLPDPMAVLDSLRPHLAPGAVVFLRVNNSHDIFNLITRAALALRLPVGRRLLESCFNLPQHYWNFACRPMTLMLQRGGWRVTAWRPTETPASRLSANPLVRAAIGAAYAVNRLIGGGKIGEYWIVPILPR